MAKKKNKQKKVDPKLLKRQQKNQFFKTVKLIIDSLSGQKLFDTIPQFYQEIMYHTRFYFRQIQYPPDYKIDPSVKKILEKVFKYYMHNTEIHLFPSENVISIADFDTTWKSICFFLNRFPGTFVPQIAVIHPYLFPYMSNAESVKDMIFYLDHILLKVSLLISRIDKIVEFKADSIEVNAENDIKGKYQYVKVIVHTAQWRKFMINGSTHSAFQFGAAIPMKGFHWFKINLENFVPKSSFGALPVDIYIQNHAINRLKERIDCLNSDLFIIHLAISFDQPKVIMWENSFLVEYRFIDLKIGYFRGLLIDGVFFIQTFLFLTNNGTPEGEKLNKLLKIEKADKQFLNIDRLSTFAYMNPKEIEDIRELFEKAGCGSLFKTEELNAKECVDEKEKAYNHKIKDYLTLYNENNYDFNDLDKLFSKSLEPDEEEVTC